MSDKLVSNMDNYWAKMQVIEFPFAMQDLVRFCLGNFIAKGSSRTVFVWDMRPNTVVKYCHADDCEANWVEYAIWQAVKDTKSARWFCPVIDISPCGRFLLMEKARPIVKTDKLPKKLPNVFTDIHTGNFGWLGSQLVCTDYQFIGRPLDIALCTNMREANWTKYF